MPQLNIAEWPPQLFWLAVTFTILYLVISRVVIPGTGGVIASRKARIDGDLAAAQKLKADSAQAIAAYEAALAEARGKAGAIDRDARAALAVETERERHAIDAAIKTKVGDAEKAIATGKAKALAGVREVAADIAADIVERLIGAKTGKNEAAAAVAKIQAG